MILRIVLICAFAAACVFGIPEMRRWGALVLSGQLSTKQRRLRTWNFVCLLATLALCYSGTFIPAPPAKKNHHLTRAEQSAALKFLANWTLAALCALPLVPLALIDARESINRLRNERMDVKKSILGLDVQGPDLD